MKKTLLSAALLAASLTTHLGRAEPTVDLVPLELLPLPEVDVPPFVYAQTYNFIQSRPAATIEEKITATGHYVLTVDDPNNEYRCFETSNNYDATTIVCTRRHDETINHTK